MKRIFAILMALSFGTDLCALSIFSNPMRNLSAVEYAAGTAQAKAGNYRAAHHILEAGWQRSQKDLRFLSQLAGINYRMGKREQAKKYLQMIINQNRNDPYANQFLGTLYLMDGNLEATLKYWNRLGQPLIEDIQLQPLPPVDPELMDRAFVMAPASELKREDFLATESRLQMMGIFKKQEFELKPHKQEGKFDLIVRPSVKKSSFSSKTKIAILAAQGVFTETIKPEFHNIAGTTISSNSLISWDEFKNRFYTSLSLPFGNHPHLRIRLFADARKETWALIPDVNLVKWESGLEFEESVNSRWKWNSGAEISHRSYDNISNFSASTLQEGWLVQAFGNFDISLTRIPERRFTLKSMSNAEIGTFLDSSTAPFLKLENSLEMRWLPRPSGEDLAMTARFRLGKMFGPPPFDEYFVLGIERDTDLLLRAHKSSIEKKGENPFAPAYLLWNWDISKNVIDKKRFRFRLAPFVDVGRILGSEVWRGTYWFLDTGIQSGFQFLGAAELVLTYGKDLRSGRNVVYFSAKL